MVAPERERWRKPSRIAYRGGDRFSPQAQHCVVSQGLGDVDLVDWQFVDETELRAGELRGREVTNITVVWVA